MGVIAGGVVNGLARTVSERILFTEGGAAGTLTGSVIVPANSLITDIKVWATVLFTAGTSALMDVGDAADPDGWYTQINVKATDLVVGEEINFIQTGGKEGVYLVLATGARTKAFTTAERVISGVITTTGTTATAGRVYMEVFYTTTAPVGAATYVAT